MTILTISVDKTVEETFRKLAKKAYKGKKGYLGDAMTEAMQKWVDEKRQKELTDEALALLRKGHHFGRLGYTHRSELYEDRLKRIKGVR